MRIQAAFVAIVLATAPLSAQDTTKTPTAKLAGNWDLSFTSPQGAATWRVKFEQSADTLWGTATTDFGPLSVTNGWVAGNDVSFTLNLNFQGTAISLNFTGAVATDTINGQIDVPGVGIPPFAFTGVKVAGTDWHHVGIRSPVLAERPRSVSLASR